MSFGLLPLGVFLLGRTLHLAIIHLPVRCRIPFEARHDGALFMSDPGNTWTDERVEQLRKLWGDGLSASQIATEIGGVSRNAVIGKVHRLGLSGRTKTPVAATTARPAPRKAPAPVPQPTAPVARQAAPSSASVATPAPAPRPIAAAFGNTALAAAPVAPAPVAAPAIREFPVAHDNVVVPLSERVTIMDLREFMCRWPVGDPTSPNFRFCGARSSTGMPYCAHHASIAYQPVMERRRDRKRA